MCGICDVQNIAEEDINLFDEDEINTLLIAIYAGIITIYNLDVNLYLKTAKKLTEGITQGYGKTYSSVLFNSEDYIMLTSLRRNVYFFSAAKTYQQTKEISSLLVKSGTVTPFNDFKKEAKRIFLEYNENYLRAEYNSSIAQSRTASQWQEIKKNEKFLPMLTYHTVGDGRVRPTHEALNNISRPVSDSFWNKFMPPNGWNCRCTVLQSSDAEKTNLKNFKAPDDVPPIFQFNAGKEKIVFSKKHPYFTHVSIKDKPFAKTNFGLPTV